MIGENENEDENEDDDDDDDDDEDGCYFIIVFIKPVIWRSIEIIF